MYKSEVEALAVHLTAIRQSMAKLSSLYESLPEIIAAEHDGIRDHDFIRVKDSADRKQLVADKINQVVVSMQESIENSVMSVTAMTGVEGERSLSLSELREQLLEFRERLTAQGFSEKVLFHQLEQVIAETPEFLAKLGEIQPTISKNRLVVDTMLTHYQESYRFWQEIQEQVASSYDNRGSQKALGRHSAVNVKA